MNRPHRYGSALVQVEPSPPSTHEIGDASWPDGGCPLDEDFQVLLPNTLKPSLLLPMAQASTGKSFPARSDQKLGTLHFQAPFLTNKQSPIKPVTTK
jgi:hypothetical protein